jgi:hypothetical protein
MRFRFTDALCTQGDEKKPACSKCHSRGEKCEWDTGVTFRCSGLDAGHPSMRQSGAGKQHPRSRNEFRVGRPSQRTMLQAHSCHGSLEDFADQDHGQIVDVAIDAGNFPAKGSANDDNPEPNNGPDQAEIAATELEALDYLMSNPSSANLFSSTTNQDENLSWPSNQSHEFMPLDQIIAESPDVYASYYPNPAYEELHTVLHHHMVETARSTALTRQGTPEATSQDPSTTRKGLAPGRYTDRAALASSASLIRPLGDTKLTSRRELELWQNYLDEVAIWLDIFDVERHFQLKIPMMANRLIIFTIRFLLSRHGRWRERIQTNHIRKAWLSTRKRLN